MRLQDFEIYRAHSTRINVYRVYITYKYPYDQTSAKKPLRIFRPVPSFIYWLTFFMVNHVTITEGGKRPRTILYERRARDLRYGIDCHHSSEYLSPLKLYNMTLKLKNKDN